MNSLMNTYGERNLTLSRGEGARVWDQAGNEYLDALSGIAVCGLGHAHPRISEALSKQAQTLIHTSNLYNIPQQQALADQLRTLSGMSQTFFSNSGAEANEAAIKIARKYGHSKGHAVPAILVMENSFHGRTLATLSATGNSKVQTGFAPLVEGFIRVPYNDIDAVEKACASHDNIVAILVEPVQGEGGVNIPEKNYLNQLRDICDREQWLLMLDEIQTGNGRTGCYFAYQHNNVLPDVVTTAKGLGNGVPIGACLVHGAAVNVLQTGNHGSTFGGNPLACSAALAVVAEIEEAQLARRAQVLGDVLIAGFQEKLADCSYVKDIRGLGLMIGIELDEPCGDLVGRAQNAGILINVTAGNTVRLLPPLIFSDEQAQQVINTLSTLILSFKD